MARKSIAHRIFARIKSRGRGKWVCTASDFLDLGSRAAVDKALSRLKARGILQRAGQGLYYYPRYNAVMQRMAVPDLEMAIKAIQRRDGCTILHGGLFYANGLHLTNAVPVSDPFFTDGSTRVVNIGGHRIQLRHAGARLMSWAGKPSMPVALALHWLGPDASQDRRVIPTLRRYLPDYVKRDLANNISNLPGWALPIALAVVD